MQAPWEAAARLLAKNHDVLSGRVGDDGTLDVPEALVARGWDSFLLSMSDEVLSALEVEGRDARWPDNTPASLGALVVEARAVCAIGPIATNPGGPERRARRLEAPRKRAQIDAFTTAILPLTARAVRVVDVGSGHGHLTRELAERIAIPVVGFERDVHLARRARSLPSTASPSFAVVDVLRDGLPLSSGDCVIGLHACGELGDAMVRSAARSGASMALVGCCLQKRRSLSRRPLCGPSDLADAIDLPKRLLGLSNLTARDEGVEATRIQNLEGRERRLALYKLLSERLLSERGGVLRLGAEIDGLNRRSAQGDLRSLVVRAFALRGWPLPSFQAVEQAAAWARAQHARLRRVSLPRALLARVLEVMVLLDQARYLEEHGFVVQIGTLFPATVSARNLVLVAERRIFTAGRKPR